MSITNDDAEMGTWWCKRADGQIVEHQTTAFENHRGHVQCVAVAPNPQANQVSDGGGS